MRHVATLALLLGSSSLAFAEAPGDYDDDYGGPSSISPVEVAPAPAYAPPPPPAAMCGGSYAPSINPLATRWAIGLSLGSMSVSPDGNPEQTADFAVSELSVRFRATYRLELELNLNGGRQTIRDEETGEGSEGDLAMGGGSLNLRYRFAPTQKWNWWLMAGLGSTVIADHSTSKEALQPQYQAHAQVGIGIERRFRRFAIQAELRATSIGDKSEGDVATPAPPEMRDPNGQPIDQPIDQPLLPTVGGNTPMTAGTFTLGVSYYF